MKDTPTFQTSVKIVKTFEKKKLGNGIDPVILAILCTRRVVFLIHRNVIYFVHF